MSLRSNAYIFTEHGTIAKPVRRKLWDGKLATFKECMLDWLWKWSKPQKQVLYHSKTNRVGICMRCPVAPFVSIEFSFELGFPLALE
jgi:hypothetical protein